MGSKFWLLSLIVVANYALQINSRYEFTNIKCDSGDNSFGNFEYCLIKAVNRTYKYISLKLKLQEIIKKAKVNIAMWKRLNGYKPFLYNYTIDACKYMEHPTRNPIANFFAELYMPFTNLNHTCPYDHHIYLEKLNIEFLNNKFTNVLPFPKGDYALFTKWLLNDIKRLEVNVYGTLS